MSTPGDRIRFARYALPRVTPARAISQEAIGLRCGWENSPQSRVYAFESGQQTLTIDKCELLAKVLNVAPEWIAFGVNPPEWFGRSILSATQRIVCAEEEPGAGNDGVRVDRLSSPGFHDPGGESVGFDLGGRS